ncbi:MAG: sulfur oxidation c-type cytochrome SoxA, partial [Methyloligellaceae bacterium]
MITLIIVLPAGLLAQDKKNPGLEAVKPASEKHPLAELFSGYKYLSEEVRAMQDSDIANPGMAWYTLGEELWNKPDGTQKKACSDCHNEAKASMRGVAARYPVYDRLTKKMVNMEQRINHCRAKFMKAEPLAAESDELVGLSIYVRGNSRGIPMKPRIEGPARAAYEKGAAYYNQRRGQMNLSCANCHDQSFGKKVRATVLSQGQS